jgi:uncharacterized FAD-dependent dehydrogenase
MKKIIAILCFVGTTFTSFSQTTIDPQTVDQTTTQTTTVESVNGFELMSKIELTQIYLNEVKTLMGTLPYSPFTLGLESDTTVQKVGLDIPMTKYTTKKLDKVSSSTKDFNKTIQTSLFEILPYSDREDIISAIIYVQSINKLVKKIY